MKNAETKSGRLKAAFPDRRLQAATLLVFLFAFRLQPFFEP